MSPELVVALFVAVVVPLVSFRLALRQDHTRWVREQRAQVYIDLLTEAYAEQQWMEADAADAATRARLTASSPDLRLPPLERARLGSRATIYASRSVNALFNRMSAEHFWSGPWGRPANEGDRIGGRIRIAEIVDELQKAVRTELRTDKLLPAFQSDVLRKPTPFQRQMQRDAQAFTAEQPAGRPEATGDEEYGADEADERPAPGH